MALGTAWVLDWITRSAAIIAEHRVELLTLDREIGDGDHGENMDRGFSAVLANLPDVASDATPGDVLKLVATTLISTVGGASGPLFGTAYLKAAGAVAGVPELDGAAIVALLTAARDGVVLRGKAEVGDKTMIDAWTPAVDAAASAQAAGEPEAAILEAAAVAAAEGAAATEPLVARKGRASYLGDRAIGHRDPGAQSTALLLREAAALPAFFAPLAPKITRLRALAQEAEVPLAALLLLFAASAPGVSRAVIGVDTPANLCDNLAAAAYAKQAEQLRPELQQIAEETTEFILPYTWPPRS